MNGFETDVILKKFARRWSIIEGNHKIPDFAKRKTYDFHDLRYFTVKIYQVFSNQIGAELVVTLPKCFDAQIQSRV
jgi:hypothetical protein